MKQLSNKLNIFAIFLLVGMTLAISFAGWHGDFIFDDIPNISNNPELTGVEPSIDSLWNASLSGLGFPGRPISMLSFALNGLIFEFEPFSFKAINTIIHSINAILVFFLSSKILLTHKVSSALTLNPQKITYLSFAISLIWAISPANIASSLYVVQRMNELSFFFTILGCLLYLYVRTTNSLSISRQFLSFVLLGMILALAILSKENGALLIPLLFSLEILLLSPHEKNNKQFMKMIVVGYIIIPLGVLVLYLSSFSTWNAFLYEGRDFSLIERLLTQGRILLIYNQQLLLADIFQISYFADDIIVSRSLFTPMTTITSLLFWLLFLLVGFFTYQKHPWILIGLAWFFIGHAMESTVLPLELFFLHRNYLPSIGIILIFVLSIYWLYCNLAQINLLNLLKITIIGYFCLTLFNSFMLAKIIGNTHLLFKTYVENHPNSSRSLVAWAHINKQLYFQTNQPEFRTTAEQTYQKVQHLSPDRMTAYLNQIILNRYDNRDFDIIFEKLLRKIPNLSNKPQHVVDTRLFLKANKNLSEPLPQKSIDDFFQLLLENKNLMGTNKGFLHFEYAQYLSEKSTQKEQALFHYQKYAEYTQTIKAKLYLVLKLIEVKKYQDARTLLSEVQEHNNKGKFLKEISQLNNAISNQRRQ